MLTIGQTYTLNGTDVYRAEKTRYPANGVFLKDLNRSFGSHVEGYVVDGVTLVHSEDFNGWYKPGKTSNVITPSYRVGQLIVCKVKTEVIDLTAFSPRNHKKK